MQSKITGLAAAFLLAALALPGRSAAGPEFMAYEGRNAVHDGQGGEKKIVDGVDFWMRGDPPRRFKILGSLTDRRHESGLFGAIRMSELDDDVAKAAKAAGGDAVILDGEGTDVIGESSFSNTTVNGYGSGTAYRYGNSTSYGGSFSGQGSTFGMAHTIRKHNSRWIVVQYMPDDTAPPPSPVAASPAVPAAPKP